MYTDHIQANIVRSGNDTGEGELLSAVKMTNGIGIHTSTRWQTPILFDDH